MKKKQIGIVGVDSGQILICDPCYVDSQWVEEDFTDIRRYRHQATGDILQYGVDFKDYEQIFYAGKNMNQMVHDKEVKALPAVPAVHKFSYNACCKLTSGEKSGGQMFYLAGHAGVGVAASSGYGDGSYPVIAHYNDEGRIMKLEIIF